MIVEVLIVDGQLLGFDLLLGIDAIKELGGVHLTELGEAHIGTQTSVPAFRSTSPISVRCSIRVLKHALYHGNG